MRPEGRVGDACSKLSALLAPRGRIVIIERGPRGGLGALARTPAATAPVDPQYSPSGAPSARSRPKASAPPGCWPSVTGCPSSKASDSGDTRRATLNFPSNSRYMYGKGFAISMGRHIPNGTHTEGLHRSTCTPPTRSLRRPAFRSRVSRRSCVCGQLRSSRGEPWLLCAGRCRRRCPRPSRRWRAGAPPSSSTSRSSRTRRRRCRSRPRAQFTPALPRRSFSSARLGCHRRPKPDDAARSGR